jgi:hypothetical protein
MACCPLPGKWSSRPHAKANCRIDYGKPSDLRLWAGEIRRLLATSRSHSVAEIAIGRAQRASVPRLLKGLRYGTCHVVVQVPQYDAGVLVGRFAADECSWYAPIPEMNLPSEVVWQAGQWRGELECSLRGRRLVIGDASIDDGNAWNTIAGFEGWSTGRAGEVAVGEMHPRAHWVTAVDGGAFDIGPLQIDNHQLTLSRRQHGNLIGLSANAPVDAHSAYAIVEDILWLLRLALPTTIEPIAMWDASKTSGLAKFDPVVRSINHQLVPEPDVAEFLGHAAQRWSQASDDEREVVRLVIDMLLVACNANLETSIAVCSAALELIADEWLPKVKGQYAVPKPARDAIKAVFVAATQFHAPGTDFAAEVKQIGTWLFNRTAKQRFKETLGFLGIAPDDAGVNQFVNMRNRVVHGGYQQEARAARIRAMLFGRWMLSTCIVRRLGHVGQLLDWRNLAVF